MLGRGVFWYYCCTNAHPPHLPHPPPRSQKTPSYSAVDAAAEQLRLSSAGTACLCSPVSGVSAGRT